MIQPQSQPLAFPQCRRPVSGPVPATRLTDIAAGRLAPESAASSLSLEYRAGNEVTGRVVAGGNGVLHVELAAGVVGRLCYRHSFGRPTHLRDFVLAHPPGAPIRVRIGRARAAWPEYTLQFADATARRWIHRQHQPMSPSSAGR